MKRPQEEPTPEAQRSAAGQRRCRDAHSSKPLWLFGALLRGEGGVSGGFPSGKALPKEGVVPPLLNDACRTPGERDLSRPFDGVSLEVEVFLPLAVKPDAEVAIPSHVRTLCPEAADRWGATDEELAAIEGQDPERFDRRKPHAAAPPGGSLNRLVLIPDRKASHHAAQLLLHTQISKRRSPAHRNW